VALIPRFGVLGFNVIEGRPFSFFGTAGGLCGGRRISASEYTRWWGGCCGFEGRFGGRTMKTTRRRHWPLFQIIVDSTVCWGE
jgi:hypothetical protein